MWFPLDNTLFVAPDIEYTTDSGGTDGNGDGNGDEHDNIHIIIITPIPNLHEYETYVGRNLIGCIVSRMQK